MLLLRAIRNAHWRHALALELQLKTVVVEEEEKLKKKVYNSVTIDRTI